MAGFTIFMVAVVAAMFSSWITFEITRLVLHRRHERRVDGLDEIIKRLAK